MNTRGNEAVDNQSPVRTTKSYTLFSTIPQDVSRNIIHHMLFTPVPQTNNNKENSAGSFSTPGDLLEYMNALKTDDTGKEISDAFGYSVETILYQAIIDDCRDIIKIILDENPSLLITLPHSEVIIQSRYTWQRFKINTGESPLSVAAKRHQYEMLNLLIPYYDQLAQDNALKDEDKQYAKDTREAGIKAWTSYKTIINRNNQDQFEIPIEYMSVIDNLINIFTSENLTTGQKDFTTLSENAESAMHSLLDILAPETAIELDNHFDIELLLIAAYQTYQQKNSNFNSDEQRNAFCIRVIGLIQSTLSPETAMVFCEGIYNVVEKRQPMGDRAKSLKLANNTPFYRTGRDSLSDIGGNHFCSENGRPIITGDDGYDPAFIKHIVEKHRRYDQHYKAQQKIAEKSTDVPRINI